MRKRVNISIDEDIYKKAKKYSKSEYTSLSRLIEDCLRKVLNIKPKT